MSQNISGIQAQVQTIIDLIAQKNVAAASIKLSEVNDLLDELIDFSEAGDDLIELSRFQVLLNHLQQKVEVLKTELN